MNNQYKAYLFGLGAVICWSTVATAFKLSLQHLTPAQLLLYASVVSCGFLLLTLFARGELGLLSRLTGRDYVASLVFGTINPLIYYLILLRAYELLPAQEAQAINYTWALTMSLLAIPILGHRLRKQDLLAALLCYCGVLVISTQGKVLSMQFSSLTGVSLALISTVIWAIYWLFNTKDPRPAILGLCLNFMVAIPLITLYCWWNDQLQLPNWQGFAGAVYIGIFEMGLSFVLWLTAMKLTQSTARISNLIFIAPFLSLGFISVFLGETIHSATLVGLLMIIAGLSFQQLRFSSAN